MSDPSLFRQVLPRARAAAPGTPLARLEMRRLCGGSLTSRRANPFPPAPRQVRLWPAWKPPRPRGRSAHPGTPTPPVHMRQRPGTCAWKQHPPLSSRHTNADRPTPSWTRYVRLSGGWEGTPPADRQGGYVYRAMPLPRPRAGRAQPVRVGLDPARGAPLARLDALGLSHPGPTTPSWDASRCAFGPPGNAPATPRWLTSRPTNPPLLR